MNHAICVDASVAVKWVVYEHLAAEAEALLSDIVAADLPRFLPANVIDPVPSALRVVGR
jgi:predicted nucleic acid-binding protein